MLPTSYLTKLNLFPPSTCLYYNEERFSTCQPSTTKMKGFDQFIPTRRSFLFEQIVQDYSGEFFEGHFSDLFVEIQTLASRAFSPGGNDDGKTDVATFSPWLQNHRDEFLKYVQLIAQPDPLTKQWATLLRSNTERPSLIVAVIMRILDTHVFSSLLFGADPEHWSILQLTDVSLVDAEGFQRSNLRAHTNRVHLETTGGLPPFFWSEVDRLSVQILTLLLPSFEWTTELKEWQSSPPSVNELYQWLHDVISYAGWLSICTRVSPGIIEYIWITPGDRYYLDQINFTQEADELSQALPQGHRQQRIATANVDDAMKRVKISMTPRIVRHMPCIGVDVRMPGTEVHTLMQPHVVCYEGSGFNQRDTKYIALPEYIRNLRNRTGCPRKAAIAVMFLIVLFFFGGFSTSVQNIWTYFTRNVSEFEISNHYLLQNNPTTISFLTIEHLPVALSTETTETTDIIEPKKLIEPTEDSMGPNGHDSLDGTDWPGYIMLFAIVASIFPFVPTLLGRA
ncbi:hypothetical protein BGZ63DRAFT_430975 [Mariannaea sp. PMI_226]|nr:hypothetical protein BGZ63DRAFT_430975 [Mariannaea sp. PMI_226]